MKTRMAIACMVCTGLLIHASVASAAGGFNETLKEKLVCSSGSTCTVVRTGNFKANVQAFEGDNLDPSEFNEDSVLHFEAGDLSFDGKLGDDPKYVAGAKSATFLVTHTNSATGKTVTDVKIVLKKGSTGMKIVATGKISDIQSPILADNYIGKTESISTNISAFVQVGTNTDHLTGVIVGTASIKTVVKNGETNDLSTVKIKSLKSP